MALNISGTETTDEDVAAAEAAADPTGYRQKLVDDLTVELSSWSPREFIVSFRRLHRGAISLVHLNVLTLLEVEGAMPMGKLADALDVSVASLTGIVSRMEARGLVERRHSEEDRRVVLVTLTDAGIDVFRGIDEHRRTGLQKLIVHLSDDELGGLLAGHRALRQARLVLVRAADERARSGDDSARPADEAARIASGSAPASDTAAPAAEPEERGTQGS